MKQRGRNESECNKETVILAEMWVEPIGEEYDEELTFLLQNHDCSSRKPEFKLFKRSKNN